MSISTLGERNCVEPFALSVSLLLAFRPRLRKIGRSGGRNAKSSEEPNLPVRWTRDENVAWKLPLPSWSGATPIIWGNRIFLNVAEKEDLSLWCVDRAQGAALWKKHLADGNFKIGKQNMSSPSPVTDGAVVYAMTGNGIVKAFDFAGKELWARDIQKDYGR